MSDKTCCVPGCGRGRSSGQPLHHFPNPERQKYRFDSWKKFVGNLTNFDNLYIYNNRRVCNYHFEKKYQCRYNRLCKISIPTINPTAEGWSESDPFRENIGCNLQNETMTSWTNEAPLPSAPASPDSPDDDDAETGFPTTPISIPTGPYKKHNKKITFNKSESMLIKRIINLRLKLSKCKRNIKQLKQIKEAKKISDNETFLKIIEHSPSAAKILTMMQGKQLKKKQEGRRFTVEEFFLSFSILKKSPICYNFLRKIFTLPSPQTLIKLLYVADIGPGMNKKVFYQLKKEAEKLKPLEKLCILVFGDIHCMTNVEWNEQKDLVVGSATDGTIAKREYDNHVQQFMILGVMKNYRHPTTFTFSSGPTPPMELKNQIKSNIEKLQEVGFVVVATICDQRPNNRIAIKMLIEETCAQFLRKGEEVTDNIILINNQEVVPLYDPPHLIKCIRNNLLTKDLKYVMDGVSGIAKWDHIHHLHKENPGYRGIRLIPKLTDKHVSPDKHDGKMKVKYATQIFSQTVAKNMGYLADKGIIPLECKDTADLLLFFDYLFDSFSGSLNKKEKAHCKPLLGQVNQNSNHHFFWQEAKNKLKAMEFISKDGKKDSNTVTIKNWIWTIEGVEKLIKILNSKYSITSFWMRHLNQDPLDIFFGSIRSHGCRNNNPTITQYEAAYKSILVNTLDSKPLPINVGIDQTFEPLIIIDESIEEVKKSNSDQMLVVDFKNLNKQTNPQVVASLLYISGYFLRYLKNKVIKGCKQCKDDLESKEEIENIEAGRKWLCTPSKSFVLCVSKFKDIYNIVLKKYVFLKNIKSFIKTIIRAKVDFHFINCDKHKFDIIENLINISARYFIHNYCKNINNILQGRKDVDDFEDENQVKAKKMFNKCFKRRLN